MELKHLAVHLRDAVRSHVQGTAFTSAEQTVTYGQLDAMVERAAAYLVEAGITVGDRVALLLPNSDAFVVMMHAAFRIGAAIVPLNPLYPPADLLYMLEDSGARAVIAPAQVAEYAPLLQAQWPGIVIIAWGPGAMDLPAGVVAYADVVAQTGRSVAVVDRPVTDVAVILYTSGTTGRPKGVLLTHANLASNAQVVGDYLSYGASDAVVVALPLFHVFSLTVCMNASIYRGAHMILLPNFSPTEVLATITQQRATIFAGVPTMYTFMLNAGRDGVYDLTSLRWAIAGGDALPVAVAEQFAQRYGVTILEGYGLSETSPVVSFAPIDGRPHKLGSIGVPLPDVRVRVVDEADEDVRQGDVGELVVQSPGVMLGYHNRAAETAQALRGGWLHTGDMARMDEDGYIFIVDRKKDMIIVGGYNVYPHEVEQVLFRHPDVLEAAVVGVPDADYGQAIVAFIVTQGGAQLSEASLRAHCAAHLVKYKQPAKYRMVDELPKNATGKVLRRQLRETFMSE